jgi:allantoicase/malate synthase/CubicO group peptidase (beta-lactamase class C family)
MKSNPIPAYETFLSPPLLATLTKEAKPVPGVPGLTQIGPNGGLETEAGLRFLTQLYRRMKEPLTRVLEQRVIDRKFIDERTKACAGLNRELRIDLLDPDYQTVIGQRDSRGRIVVGPLGDHYCKAIVGKPVAPIPEELRGNHVTLFGPPDDPKLSINAMNAFHRILKDEPPVIAEILKETELKPFWGADDEDSKTPLRHDLVAAGEHLKGCFDGTLSHTDPRNGKHYRLATERLSLPIKRFPGLALPCPFLLLDGEPLPLHLYDFALHLHANSGNPRALHYYVPKLENEEESTYIRLMIEAAEDLLLAEKRPYVKGGIRLFIVLENPRAIFRAHEIMDALHPYFAGASLGWHDYLASTARLLKNDPNYRIPVKADPDIVIKYIKASHDLLNHTVGSRGGIQIGGMYGVLPIENDLKSPSFQITLKGYFRDVLTQMKRGLSGFWVAHPDFVRIGIAMVEAWKKREAHPDWLPRLVTSLLTPEHRQEILEFIDKPDIEGLRPEDPRYARSLIVADLKESDFIPNHDPEEIRYNVFQSLQYLTDWLSGNGCVALPSAIKGVPVRVMDDLATAERSRWEVWHELHHGRVSLETFIKIAHEEYRFIRKELSDGKKIVQVKWDGRTERWYPVALELMIALMTAENPPEFASELLLPFTLDFIRNSPDPLGEVKRHIPGKYELRDEVKRLHELFEVCGSTAFASPMAKQAILDPSSVDSLIRGFGLSEVLDAASFHGDIGEGPATLDARAKSEQERAHADDPAIRAELRVLGAEYLKRHGFKFLVSAKGKSASELLAILKGRIDRPSDVELTEAKEALLEITKKRLAPPIAESPISRIENLRRELGIKGAQIAITRDGETLQSFSFGVRNSENDPVGPDTRFELASLSKTLASAFAISYFKEKGYGLETPVNRLLEKAGSGFRLRPIGSTSIRDAEEVTLHHLMNHRALNLHYVNGYPMDAKRPDAGEILLGRSDQWKPEVGVLHPPGTTFQYSGGGYLVLEHLIECFEQKPIHEVTARFLRSVSMETSPLSFDEQGFQSALDASGFRDDGFVIPGGRYRFPAFAAGAVGTAASTLRFYTHLATAFHGQSSPIERDTAIRMLSDKDPASQPFMGVQCGVGTFIAEAFENRFALHQGANDGFRALSLHCYRGPDEGKGFVIFCNADDRGVPFIAGVARILLQHLGVEGVDWSRITSEPGIGKGPKEEIVNLGYRDLLFKAFLPDRAEEIVVKGKLDPVAAQSLTRDGNILSVTNDRFARAENLFSPYEPVFDPELYGRQGKIMDSWESARHNPLAEDSLHFELREPSRISYLFFSTRYHLGNQAPKVRVEARIDPKHPWVTLVPETPMEGHAMKQVLSKDSETMFREVRASMIPDGGFTRLYLYGADLPASEARHYQEVEKSVCIPYTDPIPTPKKPLAPDYEADSKRVTRNLERIPVGERIDIASIAFGGEVLSASNEHYSPASRMISPYPPLHMFDGLESARSRTPGHQEEARVKPGLPLPIEEIELDFQYFVNNNPKEIEIHGLVDGSWRVLLPRTRVKEYAGFRFRHRLQTPLTCAEIKLTVLPDGGVNRLKLWARKA